MYERVFRDCGNICIGGFVMKMRTSHGKIILGAFFTFLFSLSFFIFAPGNAYAAYTLTSNGITLARDDGSGFSYDYAPSVIVEGNVTKMWWGGRGTTGNDVVYYASKTGGGAWSTPQIVVSPTVAWESTHLNDASVVKGSFTISGTTYTYAMYYDAGNAVGAHNKIGVAFSNDGVNWTKYSGNPILSDPQGVYEYSYGMPSVYGTGSSNITMVYFDSRRNGAAIIRTSTDGLSFTASTPYRLPFSSLDCFADIAYSTSENRWYLATKNQIYSSYDGIDHSDHETYVFRSNTSALASQDWTYIGVINQSLTGYIRNHNAGWYRVNGGDLYESSGNRYIAYGAQTNNSIDFDPNSWDIGLTTISGSQDTVSAPGSFTLSSPADGTTSVDPRNIGNFTWASSTNANNYVITISENSNLTPNDSDNTTPVVSMIHATGYESLKTTFNTAKMSNMVLKPNTTYYWSVRAVNANGNVVATNGPFTFTTNDYYQWDFNGTSFGDWFTEGGATASSIGNGRGVFNITGTDNGIRAGNDFGPLRGYLDTKNKIVVKMKNQTSASTLRVYYKLMDDSYSSAWRYKDFKVVPNDSYFREYVFDMSDQTGWNTSGKLLAFLKFNLNGTGTLEVDDIKIIGNNFSRMDIANKVLRIGVTASSSYSSSYPAVNAIDDHLANIWISAGHSGENYTEYLTLDTGKTERITNVRLTPRNDGEGVPKDFTIQLSVDGTNWNTVVTQTNYAVVTTEQVFTLSTPTDARYIKFNATKLRGNGGTYFLEIAELHADRDATNMVGVTNADFEDGLTGWALWSSSGDPGSVDTLQTYGLGSFTPINASNNYSAVFEATGNVSGSFSRTITGLQAGATYKVIVWAAGVSREARLVIRNYGGSEVYTSTTSSTWTPLSQIVTLGSGNTSLEVHLYVPASGNAWSYGVFDNVEVIKQ